MTDPAPISAEDWHKQHEAKLVQLEAYHHHEDIHALERERIREQQKAAERRRRKKWANRLGVRRR